MLAQNGLLSLRSYQIVFTRTLIASLFLGIVNTGVGCYYGSWGLS